MNIYLEAFGIFFKIGAFTIGGGYAMVPLIENEIVTKRKWIAQEDFIDLLASSNIKYIDNQLVTVIKIQMICKCKYKTI